MIDDFFDPSSPGYNGAPILSTPPSAQTAFSSVSPVGLPFGDINGALLDITGRISSINSVVTTDFETATRFATGAAGTGTVTFGTNGLDLATGVTNPSSASTTWQPNTLNVFKGSPVFAVSFEPRLSSGGIIYAGLGGNNGVFSATGAHIGFKIHTDGSLYATQADGSTETSVLLSSVTPGDVFNLILQVHNNDSVDYYFRKYYNNDTGLYSNEFSTAKTLLTNIPSTISGNIKFLADNNATTNSLRAIFFGATYSV